MAEISIFDLTNNASVYHSKDEELYWEYYGGNGTESYSPSSCGDLSDRHRDYTQIPAVSMAIAVLYSLVIFLAVTGNSLVIWTVWRNTHMHTVTNYYIVNLAISDLLVSAIVMPLKLLEYTAPCEWHVFGSDALCSVLNYLLPIFVFASVLTLVAISLERYYAIVHPLSAMKINSKSRTRKIIAVTWIIPIILASPYTYCSSYGFVIESELGRISRQICNDRFDEIDIAMYGPEAWGSGRFRRGFFIFLFLAVYLIPAFLILTTCVKIAICLLQPISIKRLPSLGRKEHSRRHEENKRKVARMVIVIAIAFIVAWSPQYIVSIVSQLQSLHGGINFLQKGQFLFTMLMTHLCGFLNSCINPFIYTIMSRKFRKSFRYIFTRVFFCCQKKRTYRYQTSLTRNQSAGLSSVGKQSLTEFRDGNEYRLSEAPSSGGDSSGGSQQGRGFQVRYKDSSQSLIESRGSNKKWATSSGKHHSGGSLIVLKCFKYKERAFKDTDGEVFENTNVPDNNTLNIKDNRRQGYLNDKAPKIEITVEDQDSILKDPKLLEIDCLETKLGHSNGKINGFALNGECETLS